MCAIISIMMCCFAVLGYNFKVSIEKKIEVESESNFNQKKSK